MPIRILYFIGAFLMTKLLIPMFFNLLYDTGCIKNNYKNESIPLGMGLIFLPMITIIIITILFFQPQTDYFMGILILTGTLAMGLAGLLDDLLGNRNVTGLKGHFKMILKGKLTTGGFKAVFGGSIALIVSVFLSHGWINIFINMLIIALFTNFINLLDLRPGRALKGFLFSGLLLCFAPLTKTCYQILFGLFGATIAYLPYDLKAKSMMGDVGSNVLGISLGIISASIPSYNIRIWILLLLILIHIYTEKYSLTKTIEKVKILDYFDKMGRS